MTTRLVLLVPLAFVLVAWRLVVVSGSPLPDPLPDLPASADVVRLTDLVSDLRFPTDVAVPPDGSPRLFVTEVDGVVQVLVDGVPEPTPFLDFSAQGFESNGSAMSGLAFHPDFTANRRLFVVMTENEDPALADFGVASGVAQQSVLYEVAAQASWPSAGANLLDPAATRELLRINEASTIHNLDDLAFGPDGSLYLSKGDDLTGGQDPTTIHGHVLRIDVDFAPGNGPSVNGQYAIPADNPFVGAGGGVLEEIWATGFRNPWRLAFDGADLWVADVGEISIEEVTRVVKGGDHGWNHKEGSFAKVPGGVSDDLSGLPPGPFVDPAGEYDHGQGDTSLTGGVIYRGSALPHLVGRYVCGDWTSGRLFALDTATGAWEVLGVDPDGDTIHGQLSGSPWEGIIAVREDADGELLVVVTERNDNPTGRVIRVGPVPWTDAGSALPGVSGDPRLEGEGPLAAGSANALRLSAAAPSALAGLFLATSSTPAPFKGGTLLPVPFFEPLLVSTAADGRFDLPFTMPGGIPPGVEVWAQWAIQDGAAVKGVALSNAVMRETP